MITYICLMINMNTVIRMQSLAHGPPLTLPCIEGTQQSWVLTYYSRIRGSGSVGGCETEYCGNSQPQTQTQYRVHVISQRLRHATTLREYYFSWSVSCGYLQVGYLSSWQKRFTNKYMHSLSGYFLTWPAEAYVLIQYEALPKYHEHQISLTIFF